MNVTQAEPGVKPSRRGRRSQASVDEPGATAPTGGAKPRYRTTLRSVERDEGAGLGCRRTIKVLQAEAGDAAEWRANNASLAEAAGRSKRTIQRHLREMDGRGYTGREYEPGTNARIRVRFLRPTALNSKIGPGGGGGEGAAAPPFIAIFDHVVRDPGLTDRDVSMIGTLLEVGRNETEFPTSIRQLQERQAWTANGVRREPNEKTIRRSLARIKARGYGGLERDGRPGAYNSAKFIFLKQVGPNMNLPPDEGHDPATGMSARRDRNVRAPRQECPRAGDRNVRSSL